MEILDLLLRLNREEGITIILVTHDPGIGARTQRIITLRDGLLSEDSQRVTDNKR
jgi:putative ABC transport system ATP-binding protein